MPRPTTLIARHPVTGARWPLRRAALAAFLLTTALVLPACAKQGTEERPQTNATRPRTTVRVENRNFLDMNIFVLRNSQRIRLGTVTGSSTQRFTIPANLIFGVSTLQFLADPVGGSRTPVSNEIRVTEGDEVTLVIPPM